MLSVNTLLPAALTALFLTSCQQQASETPPLAPSPEDVETARTAAGELGASLFAVLSEALAESGPEAAITICNEAAPEIATQLSDTHGMTIRRTALRVRNTANTPDTWERKQLEAFQTRHDTGEAFAAMEHSEIVIEDGAKTFRWMKPIPMGAPCAACHGDAITPSTMAAINALYPEDEAIGFAPGSLRGAFTATKPLDE